MASSDGFFQRKQAAAVLKHGILSRYPLVFATMTGSASTGRVVYFDGFAGPGRYEDGSPGSPMLAVETARRTAAWGRTVECYFCERDIDLHADLMRTLQEEAGEDLVWEAWCGDVSHWARAALAEAAADPMLTLLDPFGTNLDYRVLTEQLLARPPALKTEVMLNLNLESVRRIGGYLTAPQPIPGAEATLAGLDRFFGDDWWRSDFIEARRAGTRAAAASAASQVAEEFCRRVHAATGFSSFKVPVRRRPGNPPLFLLVLFYRHPYAPWKFNESVSHANRAWRKACLEEDLDKEAARLQAQPQGLFELGDTVLAVREQQVAAWEAQEKALEAEWVDDIAANLTELLRRQPQVELVDNVDEVYGTTLGSARDKHVRAAWKRLAASGVSGPAASGRLELAVVRRA